MTFTVHLLLSLSIAFGVLLSDVLFSAVLASNRHACYGEAVYEELQRAIAVIKARADGEYSAHHKTSSIIQKKFQDEDDDGLLLEGLPDLTDLAPVLPMIFRIVGSAFNLNSSGVVENSLGIIPEGVSNQLTSVLGSLANRILGTTPTTRQPPIRRRRTTTRRSSSGRVRSRSTTPSTTEASVEVNVVETEQNATEADLSTTPRALFKESSLGELPVYAAAYAPNYVATIATTSYPIYASKFGHALYSAPTTTAPPTTTDPNSFAVALPFDYEETTRLTNRNITSVTEEEDYDYDEDGNRKNRENAEQQKNEIANEETLPLIINATSSVSTIGPEDVDG